MNSNPIFYQTRKCESPAAFILRQNPDEYPRSLKALRAAKARKESDDAARITYDLSDIQPSISELRDILKQEVTYGKDTLQFFQYLNVQDRIISQDPFSNGQWKRLNRQSQTMFCAIEPYSIKLPDLPRVFREHFPQDDPPNNF